MRPTCVRWVGAARVSCSVWPVPSPRDRHAVAALPSWTLAGSYVVVWAQPFWAGPVWADAATLAAFTGAGAGGVVVTPAGAVVGVVTVGAAVVATVVAGVRLRAASASPRSSAAAHRRLAPTTSVTARAATITL